MVLLGVSGYHRSLALVPAYRGASKSAASRHLIARMEHRLRDRLTANSSNSTGWCG